MGDNYENSTATIKGCSFYESNPPHMTALQIYLREQAQKKLKNQSN